MSKENMLKTATESNREVWNRSAKYHRENKMWKETVAEVSQANYSCFDPTMTAALNKLNLSGKSVVQIGCNNGRELFSLDAFGTKTNFGIDQSQEFINQANELKDLAQKPVNFICADIYNLPNDIPNDFNVALITIGVLSWMPDLPEFFRIVAGLLNENGQLLIYETHPYLEQFEPTSEAPFTITHSYFKTEPFIENEIITYDGSQHEGGAKSYWYVHTLSKIFTCILDAKFQITEFEEFGHSNREVDYDVYEDHSAQLPMCYILQAKNTSSKNNS